MRNSRTNRTKFSTVVSNSALPNSAVATVGSPHTPLWLMRDHQLTTLDEQELFDHAQEYARRIDVFLIQREKSVLSKIIAIGGASLKGPLAHLPSSPFFMAVTMHSGCQSPGQPSSL